MIDKNGSKPPKNLTGNMRHASAPPTPKEAIGRDGGGPGRQISDQIAVTKVSKSSLHRNMPG
jgi:hypothetical protein